MLSESQGSKENGSSFNRVLHVYANTMKRELGGPGGEGSLRLYTYDVLVPTPDSDGGQGHHAPKSFSSLSIEWAESLAEE